MRLLIASFLRALAYCLHPRIIVLSLVPFLIVACATFGLAWFYWDAAMDAVRNGLFSWQLLDGFAGWLQRLGLGDFRAMLVPLVVVFLALPVLVVATLLLVAWLMTPFMTSYVGQRRFPGLARRRGGSFVGSLAWAVFHTAAALFALVLSVPLWFVPPFVLLIPPLIWGWLTYKLLAYDVLAGYASRDERRELLASHWPALLAMGVIAGYLATLPSTVFTFHAVSLVFAPWLAFVLVWLYLLVFAFASLWFAHYLLDELARLRAARAPSEPTGMPQAPAAAMLPGGAPVSDGGSGVAPAAPHGAA